MMENSLWRNKGYGTRRGSVKRVQMDSNAKKDAKDVANRVKGEKENARDFLQFDEYYLKRIMEGCNSEDQEAVLSTVHRFRREISSERCVAMQDMISRDIVPMLVRCLQSENSELQFEASWALTNLASQSPAWKGAKAVVDGGAVPALINLLSTANLAVCEQVVWALGNIIGDGFQYRDLCLQLGILSPLLAFVNPHITTSFLGNVAWVIVNLCRFNETLISLNTCAAIFPVLGRLVHHDNPEILIDALWAIVHITENGNSRIQLAIDSEIVPRIVPLLGHDNLKIKTTCLRAIGNIATGNDQQTQYVLECGILKYLPDFLKDKTDINLRKVALWFLSNLTAGNPKQIDVVLTCDYISLIIECLQCGFYPIQSEAVWVISNITISGQPEQIEFLIENGVVRPFCSNLIIKDTQNLMIILDAITNMLKSRNDFHDECCRQIEDCGGIDLIEKLQQHDNEDIYKMAFEIIDTYFTEEDIEDGDNTDLQIAQNGIVKTPTL